MVFYSKFLSSLCQCPQPDSHPRPCPRPRPRPRQRSGSGTISAIIINFLHSILSRIAHRIHRSPHGHAAVITLHARIARSHKCLRNRLPASRWLHHARHADEFAAQFPLQRRRMRLDPQGHCATISRCRSLHVGVAAGGGPAEESHC